ncbi:TolB family protein [Marinobacterium aestuariivivens]|uniref:TolB family protein n=1 Tax=Marinobacterium aestuariivivens TaxID=1698799 RepID=A0ABW2A1R4_9GAMM
MKAISIFFLMITLALTEPTYGDLAFSGFSQDKWVVYYQSELESTPKLFKMPSTTDGSTATRFPNGRDIAFEVPGRGIYLCNTQSGEECDQLKIPKGYGSRPTWWADTGNLVFARYITESEGEDSEIFVADIKTEKITPLVTQTGLLDYPDITSDGRDLAYTVSGTINRYQGGVQVVQSLWVMNLETGKARQVLLSQDQDIHPDWSPSGDELAFASNRSGQFEIWRVGGDGENLQQVTSGPGSKTWPAWSPDGESIMFTLQKDGRYSLWLVNADGTNLRPFQPFGADSDIQLRDADWK